MEFNLTSPPTLEYNRAQASAAPFHINTLPPELLLEVFSFLPQRDQMEIRAVCQRWAQFISPATFSNLVTFVLSPETDAYSALTYCGVRWKRVQIARLLVSTPKSQHWYRSLDIGSVQRLVFCNSFLTSSFIQVSLLQFRNLDELEFINSKVCLISTQGNSPSYSDSERWGKFLRDRLKSLTVEVGETGVIGDFLTIFQDSHLNKLVIRQTYAIDNRVMAEVLIDDIKPLLRVIRNSHRRLIDFSFTTRVYRSLVRFWLSFPWDCSSMNRSLRTFELISTDPDTAPLLCSLRVQQCLSFLRDQPDLTSVSLPSVAWNVQGTEVSSLPNDLETIHVGSSISFFRFPQFIQKLQKVKNMSLYCPADQFEDFSSGLLNRVLPELENLTVLGWPGRLGFTLSNSFPNLRKLVIICSSKSEASMDAVNDTELQLIIRNLTRLTVLKLSSCSSITDFGVAGIGQEVSESLLRDRAVGLDRDAIHIVRKGATLQDLQGLEELSLEFSSLITDVGVKFGLLGFRNLRILHLATSHRELTDWGLLRLGKLNPRLERMHVRTATAQKELVNRGSLEKAVVKELKSSGRWNRRNVSIRESRIPNEENEPVASSD